MFQTYAPRQSRSCPIRNWRKSFPTAREECLPSRILSVRIRSTPSWRTFARCIKRNSSDSAHFAQLKRVPFDHVRPGLTRSYVMNNKRNDQSQQDSLRTHLASASRIHEGADSSVTRRGFLGFAAASIFLARPDQRVPRSESRNGIPYRTMGRSGERALLIGVG